MLIDKPAASLKIKPHSLKNMKIDLIIAYLQRYEFGHERDFVPIDMSKRAEMYRSVQPGKKKNEHKLQNEEALPAAVS